MKTTPRFSLLLLCSILFSCVATRADEPRLTLYFPFDNSIQPSVAAGDKTANYGLEAAPTFAPGISGTGVLTGGNSQSVTIAAKDNIPSDQWTITFWMKGLPGAKWNGGDTLQTFWQLNGEQGEIMWFYYYMGRGTPWLFSRPKTGQGNPHWLLASSAPEEEWHQWAVSWRKGSGAYLFLDGQLVGQSPCAPPDPISSITIGQGPNPHSPPATNKIIDEFKIYDTALDAGSIARRYWQEGNWALAPEIAVSQTRQKIIIDGKMDDAEWQDAAGFSGLLDTKTWSVTAPQTRGRIAYDDENLYVALHSENPSEVKDKPDVTVQHGFVKRDAVQPGAPVLDDDHFFVRISPDITSGREYSLHVNGIDTTHAFQREEDGGGSVTWQSQARVKSVVGMDGWTMEAAIPLKSLGVEKIADGAKWRMNFGRVWKMLRQREDVWAIGDRATNETNTGHSSFGTVYFAGDSSAITNIEKFKIAPDGRVNSEVQVFNPGNAPREVSLSLRAGGKELQQQKLALAANENQIVTLAALPKDADGALVEVLAQSGGKTLARQSVPLILERVGQLAMWSYPSSQQLCVGWVVQSADNPKMLSLQADIKNESGQILQTVNVSPLPSLSGSQLMDTKNLPPGKYTLELQVVNGESIVQQQALPYEKKPLPEWWGNTLGISDTPPPPWTDVKTDKAKDSISVWGRDLEYSGHLLPSQIVNQGKTMLSSPMRLVVQSAGAPIVSSSDKAQTRWQKTSAVRADFSRAQTMGDIRVETDSFIEFDGMTWMEMKVSPLQKAAALSNLTIEIPLKAEWAKLFKPADDYRLQETGAMPENGWKGNASSSPWIGNGDGGFQFFQETTASWIGSKSSEVVREKNGDVVLRVHLVDAPTKLDTPLSFAFGWMASPVKAAPKNYRDWRIVNQGNLANDPQGTGVVGAYVKQANTLNPNLKNYLLWWQGWWLPEDYKENPDLTGPLPVPSGNTRQNAVRDYYGIPFYGAPYGRLNEVGTANEWFEQFGDEWVPNTSKFAPDATQPPLKQIATVSHAAPSLRDFYVWGYNKLFNEGNVRAIYYDVSRAISDTNIYHGAGTVLPDGTIEPMRNILGTRETFKRIYTLLKNKHPDGRVFYHMSGDLMLPLFSFHDSLVDGENYAGMLDRKTNRGYENVLTLDEFRTEYSAQNNIGPASVLLPQFERSGAILKNEWEELGYAHAEYVMGLTLLHDSNIWWAYFPNEVLAQTYGALDKTGWNSSWTFVPYWHQTKLNLPDSVKISSYVSPDKTKTVLIIFNDSDQDQSIDLPLSSAAIGTKNPASADALYPDDTISVENKIIRRLQIKGKNFRAILVQ
jgi:hypothetical protein